MRHRGDGGTSVLDLDCVIINNYYRVSQCCLPKYSSSKSPMCKKTLVKAVGSNFGGRNRSALDTINYCTTLLASDLLETFIDWYTLPSVA